MLKKLSIRGRLRVGFGLAILLSIIMIGLSLSGLNNARSRYVDLMEGPIQVVDNIKDARLRINVMARAVRDMVINTNPTSLAQAQSVIQENKGEIETLIAEVKEHYTAKDNYVNEWEAAIRAWQGKADQIVAAAQRGDHATASSMIINECTPALELLAAKGEQVANSMGQIRQTEMENAQSYAKSATMMIWLMLAFTVVLLVVIAYQITRGIIFPLYAMKDAMITMSKGDLHTPFEYESTDEIGVAADAFRSSQKTLSSIIGTLDHALSEMAAGNFQVTLDTEFPGDLTSLKSSTENLLEHLNQVMGQLRASGDQVASGADQVSSGAQALAQGATQQASSVEELSATISEISTASKQNAQTAIQVRDLANEAGDAIEKSAQQMQEMLSAMNDISNSSSEIGKIIKTIEDIAFQTNILALNAAVEAARAGTAGKGFAVVADEVRNLASKSAEASKNTAALIEQAIQAVERGSALATGTADALENASAKAREAVINIDTITDAVDQEASSIEQITIGIDQISAVVQTNSATSEQSAAASEELSSQAQIMHALLSRFQLEDQSSVGFGGAGSVMSSQPQYDDYDTYAPMNSNFDKY